MPDRRPWVDGERRKHVLLTGSETSSSEPGYLAGAVQAAGRADGDLIREVGETEASGGT